MKVDRCILTFEVVRPIPAIQPRTRIYTVDYTRHERIVLSLRGVVDMGGARFPCTNGALDIHTARALRMTTFIDVT